MEITNEFAIMNAITVDTDDRSNTLNQVIHEIKEQTPNALNLHGVVDIYVNHKSINEMSILKSIYQSRQFKEYMRSHLTNYQNILFLTLSFADFDTLINPNYKLTAVKVHNLLYEYTQQLMQTCGTIDDGITLLIDKNATTHGVEESLEQELITNRNLITIKISFLMFIQEICSWK